jgi:hypothetical protein
MPCHLTAHLVGPEVLTLEQAAYVWAALRRGFPDALAAVLLPDHLHAIPETDAVGVGRQRLAAVLSGVTRHWRCDRRDRALEWRLAPSRALASIRDHLARDVRYLALNPCRAGLVRDPLEWLWSTHRDVVGAVADPWVTAERLAPALGRAVPGFVRAHHAFVSADHSVRVDGTPLPRPAVPTGWGASGLERICAAALAATRARAPDLGRRSEARRLLVRLAYRHGCGRPQLLALLCHTSRKAVSALREASLGRGVLEAAELCLGDERLLAATAREAASVCIALTELARAGPARGDEVPRVTPPPGGAGRHEDASAT